MGWEKRRSQGTIAGEELITKEFTRLSEKIGGATRLAEIGAPPWVIQMERIWASQAFMRYVRSNMEDSM